MVFSALKPCSTHSKWLINICWRNAHETLMKLSLQRFLFNVMRWRIRTGQVISAKVHLTAVQQFCVTSKVYFSSHKALCQWRQLPGLPFMGFTHCSGPLWSGFSISTQVLGVHSARDIEQEENSFLRFCGSAPMSHQTPPNCKESGQHGGT